MSSESLVWSRVQRFSLELKTEVLRKSIHVLIGMVPLLAAWDRSATLFLLTLGLFAYLVAEGLRGAGYEVPLISEVTRRASRARDEGRLVLGPFTLGLGAWLCLAWLPPAAAALGIYALAFGDGLASLVGKTLGRTPLPFCQGKTLEGSLTVVAAVFVVSLSHGVAWPAALTTAFIAAALEALPLQDWDNVVLPLGTGLLVTLLPLLTVGAA